MGCCVSQLYPNKQECRSLKGYNNIYDIFTIIDNKYISPRATDSYYQLLSSKFCGIDKTHSLFILSNILRQTQPSRRITKNMLYGLLKVKMYAKWFDSGDINGLRDLENAVREREAILVNAFDSDTQIVEYIKLATETYILLAKP
jgi:hypothetical protein